jgi:hypothetical protein
VLKAPVEECAFVLLFYFNITKPLSMDFCIVSTRDIFNILRLVSNKSYIAKNKLN